jgi:hypothetical protein
MEFGKKKKSKPKPLDKKLYSRVLKKIKAKEKVWPSAYASGRVVQEYKKLGGKYSDFGIISGLTRWFKEKWVNVCVKDKKGKYTPCAKSTKKYPYCRPSVRVTSKTPKTVKEISKNKLKKICKLKKNSNKMKNIGR